MSDTISEDDLVKLRGLAKANITRIDSWLKKKLPVDVEQYTLRRDQLIEVFKEYNNVQRQLELIDVDKYYSDRDNVEEKYFCIASQMLKEINQASLNSQSLTMHSNIPSASALTTGNSAVKLPELTISSFDGNISNWPSFFELFNTLIVNHSTLSDVQKLIYLKSALKKEPLQLIDNLEVVGSSFKIALNILRDRYENNCLIVNSYIKGLLTIPPLARNNAQNLRDFLTQIKGNMAALNNFEISDKLGDLILIQIFLQKLDFNTKRSFQSERNVKEYPTLQEFTEFLEKKCTVLENLGFDEKYSEKFPIKRLTSLHEYTHSQIQRFKCFLCQDNTHKIYSCRKFLNLNPVERMKIVKERKACLNCLASGHLANTCMSLSTCVTCHQRHHTLLHNISRSPPNHMSTVSTDRSSNVNNPPNAQWGTQISRNMSHTQRNSLQSSQGQSHTQRHTQSSQSNDRGYNSQTFNNSGLETPNNSAALSALSANKEVLLPTACVTIYDNNNKPVIVRCLADSGSQTSFITDNLVNKLGCVTYDRTLQISGISQNCSISNKMVDIVLHSNVYCDKKIEISCAVLKSITCRLPQNSIDIKSLRIPHHIQLADPSPCTPAEVDILLGADVYFNIIVNGVIQLGRGLPTLQNTSLGYVVAGNISCSASGLRNSKGCSTYYSNESGFQNISLFAHTDEIDNFLEKFWEIEEIPLSTRLDKSLTPAEERAEEHFQNTTQRLPSGRFQVNLPLKTPTESYKLGDSFSQAKKRFINLEKRLERSKDLQAQYKEFISEYVSLGHAKYVPLSLTHETNKHKYFLAHHGVIREDHVTTKLRVVFDGSMKSSTGISLNDILLKGYTVQPELFDILLRFRTFRYVFIADIQKMFRQININPNQTFLLNILWRDSPLDNLKCIELQTVTYGTNCAPFLSTRCLTELANQSKHIYPLASDALLNSCYVDDILYGCNDLETLLEAHQQISDCLNSACISLHKWSSNSVEFLNNISQTSQEANYVLNPENATNKVLGMCWNSKADRFSIFTPKIVSKDSYTKREVLSIIASIYDPIGLINPIIVKVKIIMQQIWISKIGWDDPISSEILLEWKLVLENIPSLSDLHISRPLFSARNVHKVEVHGFSDASLKAYGACVYLRVIYENESVSCALTSSKSRVAPLKLITLPKLELMGSFLLSKLVTRVVSVLRTHIAKFESINLWTDSQIVLAWLKSHPSRWSTFVANRVAQIQDQTSHCNWRYVRSSDNPADIISRGSLPSDLIGCSLWWHGPQFLHNPHVNLSTLDVKIATKDLPEERKAAHIGQVVKNDLYEVFTNFSSYTHLQRTFAYCLRFINNLKKSEKLSGPLSVCELMDAESTIIRTIQMRFFQTEVNAIKAKKSLSNKTLQKLNPFLDNSGILRVGGRLSNANIPYYQKFPILLPSKNHVVQLLLRKEHLRLLHAGAQNTLSNVRLKFWPLDGLREVKRIINRCNTCFRFRAQPACQIMGDLPKERLLVSRPFTNVGVDYGGPFSIKTSNLRRAPIIKCYMAIFVCMVTRAVHIELVSNLSSDAFLLTLKRFIARRGNPSVIFSDNATNFLGAKNQLKELQKLFQQKDIAKSIKAFAASNQIQWKFIPARSPHHGGLWEAAVKSAKYHIVRTIGNSNFTFEEYTTVLAQIEAVLNSRPICELSNDPSDLTCLTPGHFLIGSSLTSYPEKDISSTPQNRLTFWKRCCQIQQQFWKRWSIDYLNRLQNRPKWFTPSKNIQVDDLVLLKDDLTTPLKWPLARIVEVLPGKDTRIRVVKVRTQDGIFIRSIAKICPLPGCQANFYQ